MTSPNFKAIEVDPLSQLGLSLSLFAIIRAFNNNTPLLVSMPDRSLQLLRTKRCGGSGLLHPFNDYNVGNHDLAIRMRTKIFHELFSS